MTQTMQTKEAERRTEMRGKRTMQIVERSLAGLALIVSFELLAPGCQGLQRAGQTIGQSVYSSKNPRGYIVLEGGSTKHYALSHQSPLNPNQEGGEFTVGIDVFRFIDYLSGRSKPVRESRESSASEILFGSGRARLMEPYFVQRRE